MQLAPGGLAIAAVPAVLAGVLVPFWWPGSVVLGIAALVVIVFHRDPERTTPPAGVVAPADGRVAVVRTERWAEGSLVGGRAAQWADEGRASGRRTTGDGAGPTGAGVGEGGLGNGEDGLGIVDDDGGDAHGGTVTERVRVGIYMRGRDVHVNRAPVAGRVVAVEHEPGGHKLAARKGSEHNERLRFRIDRPSAPGTGETSDTSEEEGRFVGEMIAGAVARRTHGYVDAGDDVERGERIGHITFSSRFDLVFPPGYDPNDLAVAEGHRVRAGETVLVSTA